MTNIKQIIARQEELAKQKFEIDWDGKPCFTIKDIMEFNSSSIKEILEGVKKFMEDNKRLENNPEGYDGIQDTYVIDVDDTINYLEEIIKKL